jgi:hypothetical protein
MTKDEIIEMARQAGFEHIAEANYWHPLFAKFAKLVAQHEREACAVVCDDLWEDDGTAYECAEAIRARSNA